MKNAFTINAMLTDSHNSYSFEELIEMMMPAILTR